MSDARGTPHFDTAVQPVHTAVPGRSRFAVAGLYRSFLLKAQLEETLAETGFFTRVDINPRTGRILLVYSRELDAEEVRMLLVEGLAGAGISPAVQPPGNQAASQSSIDVAETLQRLLERLRALLPAVNAPGWFGGKPEEPEAFDGEHQELRAWHRFGTDDLFSELGIVPGNGLAATEASALLQRYGPNSLTASKGRSDLAILLEQFVSTPVAMLGASAVISLMTGGAIDAAVILGVVLINAGIGFVTERQAEKTISSLAKSGVQAVMVLRDGEPLAVPVEEIVPGDIMLLTPGSYIAADIRLLESHKLSIDESALTGESLPVSKDDTFIAGEATPLGPWVPLSMPMKS